MQIMAKKPRGKVVAKAFYFSRNFQRVLWTNGVMDGGGRLRTRSRKGDEESEKCSKKKGKKRRFFT